MKPVVLETARLRLDSPSTADRARIVEYCSDPVFERFLTLPWPYRERDADVFLNRLVPDGWESDREYTWALRERLPASEPVRLGRASGQPEAVPATAHPGPISSTEYPDQLSATEHPNQLSATEHPEPAVGPFLGVIGYRRTTGDIGYWLGAPHRGQGFMPEAMLAVSRWIFELGESEIAWECAAGNYASVSVARAVGFRYLGEKPANVMYRDGSHPRSWHGILRADQLGVVQPEWPAETLGTTARDDTVFDETPPGTMAHDEAAPGTSAHDEAAPGTTAPARTALGTTALGNNNAR